MKLTATAIRRPRRWTALAVTLAFALLAALIALAATATAAEGEAPTQLWQRCESIAPAGQRCDNPQGVAADPHDGHVFVADTSHQRILELSPLGEFLRAWGRDVVASGPDNTGTGFEVCLPEAGDTCEAGTAGSEAGQLKFPAGVAVDSSGSVYVVDRSNHRVQKFSGKGQFELTFGGDVVAYGPDDSPNKEVQELKVAASSGTFRLGFTNPFPEGGRAETAPLPYNATAAEVQAALDGLSSISGPGGSVSVSGGPGDASGSSPYHVSFEGHLAGDDVPQLTVALDSGSQLSCSTPTSAESIAYRWLRNGEPISAATAATYTTTASDQGKAIQCQVTATNANAGSTEVANPAQLIAPAGGPPPLHPAPLPAPTASASLTVGGPGGQTLTCDPDEAGWQHFERVWGIRWYRNGVQVSSSGFGGGASRTYQVTAADLAGPAVFQCEVTARGVGFPFVEASKTSQPLATSPAPSSPPAPEAQAAISPANLTETLTPGGGPEVCKPADTCKAGVEGTAQGQFGPWPRGDFLTVGPSDRVYVGDQYRIQRFDANGAFQGEIPLPGESVQSLDVDPSGNLYAIYSGCPTNNTCTATKPAIHKLSSGGEPLSPSFELPPLGNPNMRYPTALAAAPDGHLYVFAEPGYLSGNFQIQFNRIFEFDRNANVVDEFGKGEFVQSTGLATNLCPGSEAPGNLFVTNLSSEVENPAIPSTGKAFVRAYGTQPTGCFAALTLPPDPIAETAATLRGTVNPGGSPTSECRFEWGTTTAYGETAPCAETPAQIGEGTSPVPVHADISNLAAATVYHVRLRARIGGETETGPDLSFKTLGPPTISDQHVVSATYTEAILKAQVNPEALPTTCHIDYGPTTSYGQSSPSLQVGSDRTDHPLKVLLSGLDPGTTYHWRYVCHNTAALNGGLAAGEDGVFHTYRLPQAPPPCPNDAFRIGASAALPDCRAYEMVSPVDKNGADIVNGTGLGEDPEGYVQAAPDGNRLAYAAKFPAFGEPQENSFEFNQYLATRHERGEAGEGWSSQGIHPPYSGHHAPGLFPGAHREFIAFTPDLCSAWLIDLQTPPLNPDGQEGAANLYRRQDCGPGAGSFETLTTAPLTLEGAAREHYLAQWSVQGVSADSSQAIFVAEAPLTPEAAAGTKAQIYDRSGGALHLLSLLPGGTAAATGAELGSGWGQNFPPNLQGAVSSDASSVYWTAGISGGGEGHIYLRTHPEQGKVSGECTKATKACTISVSAGADAFFWQASPDGGKALYSEGENLYRFDAATRVSTLVAAHAIGVAGASQDLGRVYFVSREVLGGSGQNGAPNLYLAEGGSFKFIATLAEGDVGAVEPGTVAIPYDVVAPAGFRRGVTYRATRVTPDGASIVFESRAPLTGFDNSVAGGTPAVEVYSYRVGGQLACVSCNPSGARPQSRELPEPYKHLWEDESREEVRVTDVQAAAWIPTWEHPLHASNVLSEDGKRIFFNSNDALLPRDTNGAQDVYEWEAAGTGSCSTEGADYFAQNGGCLYLISSGESSFESEFWEASPDGRDVFFNTASSLLPQDPGSVDLYDARVEGGFPQPTETPLCEGEACQSPPEAPNDPTPASSAFEGAGNVTEAPSRRPCRRPRVRRHGRCVARHLHMHHRKAHHKRRAAR